METIYLIKASGGSYDSSWESVRYAVRDKTQAELDVLELRERHKQCKQMLSAVRQIIDDGYKQVREYKPSRTAPLQPTPPVKLKDKEKDKAAQKEYQRKIDAWHKEVRPIQQELRDSYDAIMSQAFASAAAKVLELGGTDDHVAQLGFYDHMGKISYPNFDPDTHYDYEEIQLR